MREMKDSGIEWIGDIPEHWETVKIKYLTTIRSEKGIFDPKSDIYIGLENIMSYKNDIITTDTEYITSIYDVCKKGDILFSKLRPYLVKVIIAPFDCFCTGELMQFKSFDGNKRYFWYWLQNSCFIEVVNASTYGSKMPRANPEFILNLSMLRPPLPEQQQIANYLDRKCAEIDSLVSDIQRQIELLEEYKRSVITEAVTKGLDKNAPMKDSGIEWIGDIPEHWGIRKIKYIGSVRNGLTYTPQDLCDNGTLVLRSSNVQNGKLSLEDNVYVSCNVKSELMIKKGDILICSRNGSKELIGKNAIITEDINAAFGAFMMILRCDSPKYLYYILNSNIFSYYLGTFFTSTINQLTGANFNNMKIVYCEDKAEQSQIISYLDEKCNEIDSIISEKKQQLEAIEEYKKSLIFEYVTGKREVK